MAAGAALLVAGCAAGRVPRIRIPAMRRSAARRRATAREVFRGDSVFDIICIMRTMTSQNRFQDARALPSCRWPNGLRHFHCPRCSRKSDVCRQRHKCGPTTQFSPCHRELPSKIAGHWERNAKKCGPLGTQRRKMRAIGVCFQSIALSSVNKALQIVQITNPKSADTPTKPHCLPPILMSYERPNSALRWSYFDAY